MASLADIMIAVDIFESDDRWSLPIGEQTVDSCCFDYAVTLHLSNGVAVRIGGSLAYFSADGARHDIVPEGDPRLLAPLLANCRQVVRQGAAFKDGRLELAFANGASIQVHADADYEPWDLVGPKGLRIVSMPGGELAIWRPEPV